VYDYTFEKTRLQWKHWLEMSPPAAVPETTAFTQIIVPTLDTIRYSHLMQLLVAHGKHVLFAGPTGNIGETTGSKQDNPVRETPVTRWGLLRP
jgi:dynein heavy chain, axonemal